MQFTTTHNFHLLHNDKCFAENSYLVPFDIDFVSGLLVHRNFDLLT